MTIYILPIIKNNNTEIYYLKTLITLFGIIIFIGNLNKLLEFVIRMILNLKSATMLAAYYLDTIRDIGANMVGTFLGISFIFLQFQKKSN